MAFGYITAVNTNNTETYRAHSNERIGKKYYKQSKKTIMLHQENNIIQEVQVNKRGQGPKEEEVLKTLKLVCSSFDEQKEWDGWDPCF